MKVIDPGHEYSLDSLDGEQENRLVFVKREGAKYPGNVGSHPGTTTQEVLRALIERAHYVNSQSLCAETERVIELLTDAILWLELRAARLHDRRMTSSIEDIISGADKCLTCGHVGCPGSCRANH